jgi:hypothetical protein
MAATPAWSTEVAVVLKSATGTIATLGAGVGVGCGVISGVGVTRIDGDAAELGLAPADGELDAPLPQPPTNATMASRARVERDRFSRGIVGLSQMRSSPKRRIGLLSHPSG